MKSFITLVVLCTALLIVADAAPWNTIWSRTQNTLPGSIPWQTDEAEVQSNGGAEIFKGVLSTILSGLRKKIENGEIQSDNEFARSILGSFSNLFSAARKKVNPNDKAEQMFFNLADTFLNHAKSKIGNGQQAEAEILSPSVPYTDNAAMIEDFTNLSDEAKAQIWDKLLGSVFKGVLDRAMKRP